MQRRSIRTSGSHGTFAVPGWLDLSTSHLLIFHVVARVNGGKEWEGKEEKKKKEKRKITQSIKHGISNFFQICVFCNVDTVGIEIQFPNQAVLRGSSHISHIWVFHFWISHFSVRFGFLLSCFFNGQYVSHTYKIHKLAPLEHGLLEEIRLGHFQNHNIGCVW